PLDKKNTRDKARGLRVASERYIVGLSVRCLSTLNRGQGSAATASRERMQGALLRGAKGLPLLFVPLCRSVP
ncbi:hypothetical protein HMPREF3185_00465, partial [Porphyromonas somerae]